MELFTSALYNALGVGHKNAQTRKELCKRLRCDDRMLRDGIEVLRADYAVLNRDDGKRLLSSRRNGFRARRHKTVA